ncbi:hypothetical protein Leryth_027031, partial [Lithospermum erythrorhizon]
SNVNRGVSGFDWEEGYNCNAVLGDGLRSQLNGDFKLNVTLKVDGSKSDGNGFVFGAGSSDSMSNVSTGVLCFDWEEGHKGNDGLGDGLRSQWNGNFKPNNGLKSNGHGFVFGASNSSSTSNANPCVSGFDGEEASNGIAPSVGANNSTLNGNFKLNDALKVNGSKSDGNGFVFGAGSSGSMSNANSCVSRFDQEEANTTNASSVASSLNGNFKLNDTLKVNGFVFRASSSSSSSFMSNANPCVSGFDGEEANNRAHAPSVASTLNGSFKLNHTLNGEEANGFVFGASSISSSTSNENVEHMEFGRKDDKSRAKPNLDNECFGYSGRKSSGTANLNSEMNCINGINKGSDASKLNLKNEGFAGFGNSKARLSPDRRNSVFVFGDGKNSNTGKEGGFVFGDNKDGLLGNLNIFREGVRLGAKTKNAAKSTKSRDASKFSSTAFEFGTSSNAVPKQSAENVVECGAKKYESLDANEKSKGNLTVELEVELDSVASNNPCSDRKTRWDDNTGVGGTDKRDEKINLAANNMEESLLSKLTDEMKRFTIHDGEAIVRENKLEESTTNFFVNFETKFVLGSNKNSFGVSIERDGLNNRSPRVKMPRKIKSKLRRGLVEHQLDGEDNVPKRDGFQKNDDSPGCRSPMDFSPYRPTDTVASGCKGNADKGGLDTCVNDDCSRGYQSNSDNRCPNRDNGEMSGDFPASSSGQDGLSSIRHQYKRKYKLKVGNGLNDQRQKAASNFVSEQSSTVPCNSSRTKKMPNTKTKSKNMGYIIQERAKHGTADVTSDQTCDGWRIRGNQAYKAGNLSTAEEYYTKGIDSVSDKSFMQPLLLCYSNRAATRMSLGRIREALSDCKMAATLDTSFLKVKLRAANCHLVLGEVKDANMYYNDCLESERHICLDRRITIEAADGLQKAQKVAEYMRRSDELLQQCSSDAANSALEVISEALKISCYSDKLFEMKGEALCKLLMYEEAIQLCEKTLHIAERNFMACHYPNVSDNNGHECFAKLWRWRMMAKSHYHLGELELALDLIEKQEQLIATANDITQELSNVLAVSIRQLLAHKKAGNEAFQGGRHVEAVEHYTAAISKSVESRPFAAICFCNRAAAYQAMGQLIDAISDCSLAIALDQNYSKAVSRRATLHELIRDYEQAANDLQRLIYLLQNQPQKGSQQSDISNKSGGSNTKELQRARTRLSSVEKKLKKRASLDLYSILGVKASDAESDIKKAYRKAALKHHPDKAAQLLARNDVGDDVKLWKEIIEKVHKDADRLFKMIGESYSVLSDPEKRLKYNDEEELRDVLRSNSRSSHSGKTSDYYNSPSGRRSDSHGYPFGRSGNQRNWEEGSWRGYNTHYRW